MKKIVLGLAIISSMGACKKSDNTVTPVLPVCAVTTSSITGAFKITAIKYKASATGAESDNFSGMEACKKDNIYQLNADGSLTVVDAGVSCGLPPGPGAIDGWMLTSNNTILQLAGVDYTVESFNCTDLVIYESNVSASGDKRTTTYTKQ